MFNLLRTTMFQFKTYYLWNTCASSVSSTHWLIDLLLYCLYNIKMLLTCPIIHNVWFYHRFMIFIWCKWSFFSFELLIDWSTIYWLLMFFLQTRYFETKKSSVRFWGWSFGVTNFVVFIDIKTHSCIKCNQLTEVITFCSYDHFFSLLINQVGWLLKAENHILFWNI